MNNRPDDPDELADEVRQLLISHGAQPRDLAPLPGEDDRAERRLAEILRSPRRSTPSREPSVGETVARRRRWVRAAALVASAAALAVGLVVLWSPTEPDAAAAATPALLTFDATRPGELPTATRPAADALMDLARRSRSAEPPAAGPVQHVVIDAWWSSSEETDEGARSELIPIQSWAYFFPNGLMRVIQRRGEPLGGDSALSDPGNWEQRPITSDDSFESLDPGPAYVKDLPTDPDALRAALAAAPTAATGAAHCAPTPGGCVMADVISLHQSYVVPPALTAALWEVLAQEPSVRLVGATHDRLGREAIAFMTRAPDGASQQLLLADPETGAYLGEEKVLVEKLDGVGFTPPAVTSFSAIVESRRIAKTEVPPAP